MHRLNRIRSLSAVAACMAGLWLAVLNYAQDRKLRGDAEAFATKYDVARRVPDLAHEIRYELAADLTFADLGRQAMGDMTGTVSLGSVSPEAREAWLSLLERGDSYLADARELCLAGLRARPASADHAFCLAGTTFIAWYRRSDGRLSAERSKWSEPLALAARRAPGADDIASFRAEAELEAWPEHSGKFREIFRRAFLNPRIFERLFPTYAEALGGWRQARSEIPDRLPQRQFVSNYLAALGDVDGFVAEAAEVDRLSRRLAGRLLSTMRSALLSRRVERAEQAAVEYVGSIPLSDAGARGFVLALECWPQQRPEGWSQSRRSSVLEFFLDGREKTLTPAAIQRTLATMNGTPSYVAAQLLLLAGDVTGAERMEQSSGGTGGYDWWPYRLARARAFLGEHRPVEARAALAPLGAGLRAAFDTRVLEAKIARLAGETMAEPPGKSAYAAGDWGIPSGATVGAGRTGTLFVEPPPDSAYADVHVSSPGLSAVTLGWDGDRRLLVRIAGETKLTLPVPARERRRRLELTTLVGDPVTPGSVTLRPSPPQTTSRGRAPGSPESPGSRS